VSLVPFHKNEGASGDVDEKKGTGKSRCTVQGVGRQAKGERTGGMEYGSALSAQLLTSVFCLLSPALKKGKRELTLDGISREVIENKQLNFIGPRYS
jgi:hypothetical protein